MCITNTYALICLDTIHDASERAAVVKAIKDSGKGILEITKEQKIQFAGNMLLVKGAMDQLFLVMSGSAYRALTPQQVARIELDVGKSFIPTFTLKRWAVEVRDACLQKFTYPKNLNHVRDSDSGHYYGSTK